MPQHGAIFGSSFPHPPEPIPQLLVFASCSRERLKTHYLPTHDGGREEALSGPALSRSCTLGLLSLQKWKTLLVETYSRSNLFKNHSWGWIPENMCFLYAHRALLEAAGSRISTFPLESHMQICRAQKSFQKEFLLLYQPVLTVSIAEAPRQWNGLEEGPLHPIIKMKLGWGKNWVL